MWAVFVLVLFWQRVVVATTELIWWIANVLISRNTLSCNSTFSFLNFLLERWRLQNFKWKWQSNRAIDLAKDTKDNRAGTNDDMAGFSLMHQRGMFFPRSPKEYFLLITHIYYRNWPINHIFYFCCGGVWEEEPSSSVGSEMFNLALNLMM